ncbi:hypothetical protein H6P81_013247 [Aristolochia fimbriata]|uniref:MI domain-containing protein n=1 Tax=Aristolochia fimbriata TaxID=158543 RepID=A0AAV7EEQ2_ARIFI|nr:hypothetical protein H6P81_013247 [Aristolochia fimbriata]
MTKGFERLIDRIDDLSLDIIGARDLLQSLISKAASEGWLCASQLKPFSPKPRKEAEEDATKIFKTHITSSIKEYFLIGDILEMVSSLESENDGDSPELNAIFIKRLITLAMDRKNRETQMASVLLTSLCLPPEEYDSGGDVKEAFSCIKELSMPFFHHEVVKKALELEASAGNSGMERNLQCEVRSGSCRPFLSRLFCNHRSILT